MGIEYHTYELLKNLRRKLHHCPEKSGCEERTMELLKGFLRLHTTLRIVDCNGWFYAVHQEEGAEKSVAFRADMDAIKGEDGRIFHGCGHDGHSAVLAGLCLFAEGKKLGRNVYFLFQPAEETGQGGEMCSRLLTEKGIEEVYAFHNLPGCPLGTVVLREGTFACASRGIILTLKGRQCHAAYPEQGINPAWLIGELICCIPEFAAQPGYEGMVLATIIEVKVGEESFGVSPGEGKLALTLRAERLSDLERFQDSIRTFAEKKAGELKMDLQISVRDEFPDTVNDPHMVEVCRRRLKERGIPWIEASAPLRWSEDFGWYLKKAGGLYFGVGAGEACPDLHTAGYEFPDEVMETALASLEALL